MMKRGKISGTLRSRFRKEEQQEVHMHAHAEDTTYEKAEPESVREQINDIKEEAQEVVEEMVVLPSNVFKRALRFIRRTLRPFVRLHFILSFFITTFILVAIFIAITYITYANDITSREKIMNRNNLGIIIYDKDKRIVFREGQAQELKITPIDKISEPMRQATLASEDVNFYNHPGISIPALAASLIADFRHLDPFKYGGSTITQQLVKNSLLGHEKSYSRKLREIVLAIEIERRYTKDEILEIYMNSVYYGAGAYGIEQAAKVYFNEDAAKITLPQAGLLAGLPNAPSLLSPYGGDKEKAFKRQYYVLDQMRDNKLISAEQAAQAKNEQLVFAGYKSLDEVNAPHFALWVRKLVVDQFSEDQAVRLGYRVYTTIDLEMQKVAEEAVRKRVTELKNLSVTNGALVALDPKTGAVKAMVGSVDYNNDEIDGKFNVAIDGVGRQPGSSFKPFVYAAAFDRGILTPADKLHDKPTDFGVFGGEHFKPKNYDGKFRGDVPVRKALANSLNIPAVEALQLVGVSNAIDTAERMGITTLQDRSRFGLSLVLGGGEVHLLEMVQAYSVFASNGKKNSYYSIDKIEDKFGNLIYDRQTDTNTEGKQVIDARAAYLVTHILSDNNARSEVFGSNSPLRLSRPAAAKTGTTDDYKDSWTLGYTPNLVAGAWIGNNNGIVMKGVAGALGAAQVWKSFMEQALPKLPKEDFVEPEGIVKLRTCSKVQTKEQRLLEDGTPYDHFEDKIITAEEVFIKGTEPKEACKEETTPQPVVDPNAPPQQQAPQIILPPGNNGQVRALPEGYFVDDAPDDIDRSAIVRDDRIIIADRKKNRNR